jgi:hypothetical protein
MRKSKITHKKVQENKRKKVIKYLRYYQKKFKLSHIKFKVIYARGSNVKDFYAEILMNGNRVRIKFNEDLMDQRPQEIQDTVVHELLHVLFYKIMNKIMNVISAHVRGLDIQEKYEEKLCYLEHEVITKLVPNFISKKNLRQRGKINVSKSYKTNRR